MKKRSFCSRKIGSENAETTKNNLSGFQQNKE